MIFFHANDSKPLAVSALGGTAIKVFADMGLDQLITYGLQSTIALLTILYLITKIRNNLKNKP